MKALTSSLLVAAIGVAVLCPVCETKVAEAKASQSVGPSQASDTATVRLHISGMTCGTCPLTARKALGKLSGVYSATVTYEDSLGVVRFNPAKVKPTEIATHLTKMTGYGAKVLPDSVKAPRTGGPR